MILEDPNLVIIALNHLSESCMILFQGPIILNMLSLEIDRVLEQLVLLDNCGQPCAFILSKRHRALCHFPAPLLVLQILGPF
jgi:hypothetical protein